MIRISIADLSAVGFVFCKTEAKISDLLSRLSNNQSSLQQNPLAVLNVVYEEYGQSCETARKRGDDEVVSIESTTGMTSLTKQAPKPGDRGLAELNKSLHAVNTNLIFIDTVTNFDVAAGRFIKEISVRLETMRQTRNLEPAPVPISQAFYDKIDYLINVAELRRYQAQSLHRRVQSQISVVSKTD